MQNSNRTMLPWGAFSDVVTPFRGDAVDTDMLKRMVQWQIENGVSGVVVCGQAGEATSLTREERATVIQCAVEASAGSVPVVAGTGTNATASTIMLTSDARELGASAVVIVTPYYNKPSQEGIYRHYELIAEAVDMPIIVCNVPGRTASDLASRTLERLAGIPSIVGVEDCTGDISRLALMQPGLRKRFAFYSGHDLTALSFNLAGGFGSFSIVANIAPRLVSAMHDALRSGSVGVAATLNSQLNPLLRALEIEPGTASIKHALHVMQGADPEVRLPLTCVAPEAAAAIRMALAALPNNTARLEMA